MKLKKEAKLAITVIVTLVVLVWGLNTLKSRSLFKRNNIFYGIYAQVDGLKMSSAVVYRGFEVGQVESIKFTGAHYENVFVAFSVDKDLQIPANTVAMIDNSDLMGTKSITLLPGDSPLYAQDKDTLQTSIYVGIMDQVRTQISPLKDKAESIMNSLDTVLSSIQTVLRPMTATNIESSFKNLSHTLRYLESVLANLNSVSENLKNNNANVTTILNNVSDISESLHQVNFTGMFGELDKVVKQMDAILYKVNSGQGTAGKLVTDEELYRNLVSVSADLDKLLTDFKENPKRYINISVFGK
ncbi:hypothetical protein FACS1894199_00010 [Bacteroidia bacterium]|nr:hypothetical protein FACS1894199_00010 [Bacteroidia bacterium]